MAVNLLLSVLGCLWVVGVLPRLTVLPRAYPVASAHSPGPDGLRRQPPDGVAVGKFLHSSRLLLRPGAPAPARLTQHGRNADASSVPSYPCLARQSTSWCSENSTYAAWTLEVRQSR